MVHRTYLDFDSNPFNLSSHLQKLQEHLRIDTLSVPLPPEFIQSIQSIQSIQYQKQFGWTNRAKPLITAIMRSYLCLTMTFSTDYYNLNNRFYFYYLATIESNGMKCALAIFGHRSELGGLGITFTFDERNR